MCTKLLILAAFAVLSAGPVQAQDYSLKLKDGSRVTGKPTAYDDARKVLSFRTSDGQDRNFTLDELDARSVYMVNRSLVPKDDYEAQLQVANYARDIELFAHSARHYRNAREAGKNDPAFLSRLEKNFDDAKRQASVWALGKAQEAAAKKNEREAVKWLTIIIEKLPDEPAAREAQSLLDQYYTRSRAKLDEKAEQDSEHVLRKELAQGKRHYDHMIEKTKKGLSSKGSTSTRQWESAIKDGNRALKEIDKFEKKQGDASLKETLDGYRATVTEHIIDVRLHLASSYMTRTSYQQALAEVNKGLSLDPENERALSMRSRIENAAADSGWGWGRGRLR